jgi:hypothetical protein
MISFDVSLFTLVPIRETMSLLSRHFEEILRFFRHALMASYFSFAGHCYEQIDGTTMGSPLFPVIANFCHLVTQTQQAEGLPRPPSSVHQHIQFPMETETATFPSLTQIFMGDPIALGP